MNLFEHSIAAISPEWAAKRAYFRAVLAANEAMQSRKYDAASRDRRTGKWNAPSTGPNAEIAGAVARIRDRGRDLVRNNPHAATAPRKLAAKIVGKGIFPRLAVEDAKQRAAAKDIWDRFADHSDVEGLTDFYAQQHVAARCFIECGEFLVRWTVPPKAAGSVFPLQCSILEPDFLDNDKNETIADGGAIIQGVQYDAFGRRVGYWLYPEHPGESLAAFTRRVAASSFVPASECDHVLDQLRPGQARGVSMFAASALSLRDIEDYKDAEMMRRKIAACFAVFRRPPQGNAASPMTRDTSTDAKGNTIQNVSPGAIYDMKAGEDVSFSTPPRVESLADTLRFELRAVAAGIGMTYEQMTGDLTGVNFSSIRIGVNDFLDVRDHWREHVFLPMMLRKSWRRVGRIAAIAGYRKFGDPWADRWIYPRDRMLSPIDDVEAAKDAARALLRDPLDVIAEFSGEDPLDIIDGAAQLNKLLDDNDLTSDIDPRKVGRTSTPSPQAAAKPAN